MWRVLLLFALLLMVGDATGLIPEADEVACSDGDDGKGCPPSCPTCACAWHSITPAPVERIELACVERSAHDLDLPPVRTVQGRLAPDVVDRPPIA